MANLKFSGYQIVGSLGDIVYVAVGATVTNHWTLMGGLSSTNFMGVTASHGWGLELGPLDGTHKWREESGYGTATPPGLPIGGMSATYDPIQRERDYTVEFGEYKAISFGIQLQYEADEPKVRTVIFVDANGQIVPPARGYRLGMGTGLDLDLKGRTVDLAPLDPEVTKRMYLNDEQGVPQSFWTPLDAQHVVTILGDKYCFAADTPVLMADGSLRPIAQVRVGDMVASFNPESQEGRAPLEPKRVLRLFRNTTTEWIQLSNGVVVTPGHQVLTRNGEFASVKDVLSGDLSVVAYDGQLLSIEGVSVELTDSNALLFEVAVDLATMGTLAMKPSYRGWATYNFEVEDYHTYVAGGLRVHNASLSEGTLADAMSKHSATEAITLTAINVSSASPFDYLTSSSKAVFNAGSQTDLYSTQEHVWRSDLMKQLYMSDGSHMWVVQYTDPATGKVVTKDPETGVRLNPTSISGGTSASSASSVGNSSGSGGNGGSIVTTSTGKQVQAGSTYTSGTSSTGQPYHYVVNSDGSITNTDTGRVTAPAPSKSSSSKSKPILIDLDGDGIDITQASSSNIFYDMAGDGKQHRTAWTGAGDGVLVRDSGNDGLISAKNEVDFTEWDATATSDMQALRDIFDTNHNNQLDSGDADWALFKVLVTNADGTTSLQSLSSLGITSINLISNNQEITLPDGSKILGATTYTKTGGGTGTVADAALSYDANGFVVTKTVTVNGDGSTTIDNEATNPDGSLANETTATTSASGLSVTTKFDDDGDGVFDRVETRVTVANGDGSHTETLSRYDGSGTILGSKQVKTISADTKTVSIGRDSTGSGSNDQTETEVIDSGGAQIVTVTDLNRNGSTHDKRITTTSADGLTKTLESQLTGSGVVNATTTTNTSVGGDGTRTETVTSYAGSGTSGGNLIGSATTITSADGSSRSVATDLDGDGLTDVTVASTIVVNGDGSRTTTQTATNRNSTLRNKTITLLSTDGNTTTVQTDADGDGNYESTNIDAEVLNLDGSITETVTNKDVNGVVTSKSVSTWSADGKTRAISVDGDGDSVNDQIETVAIVSTNSVDTKSIYSPNGITLLSKSVATTSADGLTQTTQTDANGDGSYDAVETATTVINVDHSSTLTVIHKNGAGTVQIDKTVTTTSADGLSTTTQSYLGTATSPYATTTDVQVLNGDGSTTETVTNFAGTGNVQTGKQVITISADRLTTTVKSFLGTNSLPENITTTVEASDGSKTKTESHYNPTGSTLLRRTTTSISADGLTSTIATDVNGDGVTDSTRVTAKVLNSDGTTTVTTTVYAGSGTSTANQVNQSVVTTSGNGLSVTTLTDLNGDGVTNRKSMDTTVLNADGSKTETVATFNGDGTIQTSKTVLAVSDDGLSKTRSTYLSNHSTADAVTTDAIVFATDGSTVETVSAYTGNGSLRNKRVTTTSANVLSSTTTEDLDGNASTDRQTVTSVSSNGSTVTAVSNFDSGGSLTSKSTTTVSGNGLSTSVVTDLNGDTVTDLSLTDAIVLNADGSKTETLSNFKAGGVLKDKTVVTTAADGLSVTTQWDTTGGGTFTRSATDVIAINADGSTTETLSNLNANGSLHDKAVVTTSADKRSVTTTRDLNGDATVDQTIAQVQNSDGSVLTSSMDGSVLSASGRSYGSVHGRYQTVSADGLSTTVQYDANGNSLAESQTTDVTMIHADGSTTRTITDSTLSGGTAGSANPVYTVTGKDKAVIDKSADGLSTTTQWDLTGSGTFTEHESVVTVLNSNGSSTKTTSFYVGAALKSRMEVTDGADGLTKTTKWDTTGAGTFDQVAVYTKVVNADGSMTETTANSTGAGALFSKTTVTTSADGFTVTTLEDLDGSGTAVRSRTSVTNVLADGSTVVTTSNYNPGGTLRDRTVTTTSADGATVSETRDANGDGTVDQTKVLSKAVDGSTTVTLTDLSASGATKTQSTSTGTFDGLSTTTNRDLNGDGAMNATGSVDKLVNDTSVENADRSSSRITQIYRYVSGTTTQLAETVTTATSADGRTTTTTVDVDANGSVDETSITVTRIDGSSVTTVTDNAAARGIAPSVGDIVWSSAVATSMKTTAAATVVTVDADGMTRSIAADYDANGTYEHSESWKTRIDGVQVGTISDKNASGTTVASGTEAISADGLTTTLLEDTNMDGTQDHQETSVLRADGTKVKTVTDLNATGTLKLTVVTTVGTSGQVLSYNMTGGAANDTLTGSAGDDVLNGGAGADTMIGGDGNDTYVVDNSADIVTESGTGTDVVQSSVTYSIASYGAVENLTLTGASAINGTGNGLANVITGNSGANVLNGGAGADTLIGGDGNDTYVVDNTGDVVTETGTGVDLVQSSVSYSIASYSSVENLTLTGSSAINGTGNGLANTINGNSGANVLTGGAGSDILKGGAGNDTYVFNRGDGADTIDGELIAGDSDTLSFGSLIDLDDLRVSLVGNDLQIRFASRPDLPAGFDPSGDVITITNWANANNRLQSVNFVSGLTVSTAGLTATSSGTPYSDEIDADFGDQDVGAPLAGMHAAYVVWSGGNENYASDNIALTTSWTSGAFGTLRGDEYDVWFSGELVVPTDGDYTFYGTGLSGFSMEIDNGSRDLELDKVGSPPQQTVTLTAGTYFFNGILWSSALPTGSFGLDWAGPGLTRQAIGGSSLLYRTNQSWSAAGGSVWVDGAAGEDYIVGTDFGDVLTGGAGDDEVFGGSGDDVLSGGAGADTLWGDDGNDKLFGADGNDYLDGLAGNDTMDGGAGDDRYVVDSASDVIVDTGGGIDKVYAGLSWTLGANLENLTLVGTSAINGTGNALDNIINGNSAANVLSGGAGNDTLDGKAGADSLIGGDGNDTYVVDNAGDVVTEATSQGTDLVSSSVTYTLAANVENLTLAGTTAINGTGNALDNIIVGNSAGNVLTGGDGNDTLDGGAGADTLVGGNGNDLYVVDNSSDVVSESGTGIDTVQSGVTYTLGANLENLALMGTSAINGTGNSLDNVITGNSGTNTLTGGAGNDSLDGGAGADTLIGGDGSDTYFFGSGWGNDTIGETTGATDIDKVRLVGLNAANVTIGRSGNDLLIMVNGTGDILTVTGHFTDASHGIEQVVFGDSSTMDRTAIAAAAWFRGTSGADTLGTSTNPLSVSGATFDLGLGNDSVYSDAANAQTIVFGTGDGADTYRFYSSASSTSVLSLSDLNAADLTLLQSGNDLIVDVNGTSDAITIKNQFNSSNDGINQIRFADTTIWSRTDIVSHLSP